MRVRYLKTILVLVAAIPLIAAAQKQKDSPLRGRLEAEFMGKSFETKVAWVAT